MESANDIRTVNSGIFRNRAGVSLKLRIALFVVALAVRIAAIEFAGGGGKAFGDAHDYIDAAQSICAKGVYPERGNLPFFRPPGLPFFIATVTACHPGQTKVVSYALAVCDAGTVVLIAMIAGLLSGAPPTSAANGGRRETKRPAAGGAAPLKNAPLLAGAIAAFHPFFIAAVTDIRSEPLFMYLLTLSIWFLLKQQPGKSGVAVALAALTRPTALLCIPLFALFARRRGLALITAALLTLAPWVARNYLRFGEVIAVNDAAGFNFWRGAHPELIAAYDADSRAEWEARATEFETRTIFKTAAIVDARESSPASRSRLWFSLGIAEARRDPAAYVRFTLKKLWLYWRPWLNPLEYSRAEVAVSGVVCSLLYLLAAIGMWRADRRLALAAMVFFIVMCAAQLPYQITMRFRIPLTDPLLIVFASAAFSRRIPADEGLVA
jgi:hypothetical protein